LLVISNGYGEDTIAANILKELLSNIEVNVRVLPIVGEGKAYRSLPVKVDGSGRKLPSGGFARNSFSNLMADLKAGLLGLTLSQIAFLRRVREEVDLVLVVGDVFILLMAGLFVRKEIVFLPTAKSEYISGHYRVEELLMKKMAQLVLPRDNKTAEALKARGVKACFAGNAMMDCFEIKGEEFNLSSEERIVGILPGSREEAYDNLLSILEVIEEIERHTEKKLVYLTAMASNLSAKKLQTYIEKTCWKVESSEAEKERGIYLTLFSPNNKSRVKIIYHHFGDILKQAELFIGMAGTANEQAAGMGKPVVIFPGKGAQFNESFARAQKSLLGESVELVDAEPKTAAETVLNILNDEEKYHRMALAGRERMGPPGGIKKMVAIIIKQLNR